MNTSFENLIKSDEDERELTKFFSRDKIFLVLTNAGKPVYSK